MLGSQRNSAAQLLRQVAYKDCCRTIKSRLTVELKQDVEDLGPAGSFVEVAPGFARNFLIPHKRARYLSRGQKQGAGPGKGRSATQLPVKKAAAAASKRDKQQLDQQQQFAAALERLASSPLSIARRAFDQGRLRSPLTAAEVVEAARDQRGVELSPALVELADGAITGLGQFQIPLRCFVAEGVKAAVEVDVQELSTTQTSPAAQ